ncbi:NAD-dependent deacetylase [Sediminicola sp. YIK13]|uniref:SIR2 family NAD-dependent protein deacylase n=1 Tax=Sediminicola sp. YIK13 TaxID=1453352 RepID=UPI00071EFF9B|nr:NAD-dependent deacylase [Sediminicola sp. YIK13]ALM07350.1 NAD-dependent deacetylase [Sediminicola sp. YIK13]
MRKKIVVLTGAGVSAESGLKTFRDSNGLWEGHDVMEVATPEGYANNPSLVLNFYNQRRKQLFDVLPNQAHMALVQLEKSYDVTIITQNVDDLHERAGSSNVIHLHGELLKVRSSIDPDVVIDWKTDLKLGDTCDKGSQLRPHIVWFGEEVPMLDKAIGITQDADILMIIGTSMQVYPAASLVHFAPTRSPIYYIDPKPNMSPSAFENLVIVQETAVKGVPTVVEGLIGREL